MDVLTIPLYYIGFEPNDELERKAKQIGFSNINYFEAIDGRAFDPKNLLDDKLVTIRAYKELIRPRHDHYGLPSLGAVGCTMSHDKLWNKCVDNNQWLVRR